MSEKWQSRTALLLGEEKLRLLAGARVAIFGVGGVGGYAAEALARAGVGALDFFDPDTVNETNRNRQILALCSTEGQYKAEVAAARAKDINPAVRATAHKIFYLPENADEVDLSVFDFVIDAVDTLAAKIELMRRTAALGVPFISSMGTGNKQDPTKFTVCDVEKTVNCPLARAVRVACRREGLRHIRVVYSPETPMGNTEAGEGGRHIPGSLSFVPAAAGLLLAAEAVRVLTNP